MKRGIMPVEDLPLMLPINEERDEYLGLDRGLIAGPEVDTTALHLFVSDGDGCETGEGEIWIPLTALDALIEALHEFKEAANA